MSEKTEKPTPKKLRDARKKGQVAHSKELVSTAMMIAMYGLLFASGYSLVEALQSLIDLPPRFYGQPFEEALQAVLNGVFEKSLDILLPFILLVIVTAVVANVGHVGPLFAMESVKFDLKKIDPVEGVKKLFSVRSLVELLKSIVKILFLSILIYWVITSNLNDISKLPHCGSDCIMSFIGHLMLQLAMVSMFAFVIVAVLDFLYQKHEHQKQLRMTKDEVKREYKDAEGNPEVIGQRKQIHREMLDGGMISQIKKASVIVTNPTHIAIGIYYDGDKRSLPTVIIKAKNTTAQRVKKIAAKEGIPIMENIPLARALYAQAELENYIPSELIEPVAEVLKWVAGLES
ncbi:EscU/YscU/HrcU family type III secretion system export apparatus switch protein [Hahella sp. KA22]|uniref:type III secretion system export apparatus subunit SctU n=1 Tax=Hahella sp. KA22 TaxID=1628392 RepID=UPI000FDD60DE|nr:type III secretion system export apparatus subunit SctU [Hahella sp. KA22]AZZ92401.1 EscU/YscU/HrcU family type III secretion system export apparatus switch protein [Hahella sp. KA22]QAY55776.1 EscU/YscU/HrcU family type III secretion system export apparatus switch protein [Hahella sp. KA22]